MSSGTTAAADVTVRDAIASGASRLREAGSPTPRLDAELLVGHLIGRDRAWLLAHPEERVDDSTAYTALIERRAGGEPVAYLRGFKEWHGLRIRTDRRALIPRPETELLADVAAAEIEARLTIGGRVVAWDVGTGTGAVAIALALGPGAAHAGDRLSIIASDVSAEAFDLALDNLRTHGVDERVELVRTDLLAPAGAEVPRPDVIVANLPYVTSREVDARGGSLAFEPRIALDGGPDGLDVVRRLIDALPAGSAPGAVAFLEVGVGQAMAIEELVPPGATVGIVRDLAGLERVVRIEMPRLAE
jgi:release factor glutamine methyltransferase